LADALAEAMTELAACRLVVDLGAVTFIDSSGLTAAIVLPAVRPTMPASPSKPFPAPEWPGRCK
jgi:hypothetical protein